MSGKITRQFIQHLIATIDIVDVIGSRVTLSKKGKDHSGRCPFHQEKTPSFTVSQPKQFYHCFGCSAHGNVIDFIINHDNLSFPDAVEHLAELSGLTIEYEGNKNNRQPDYQSSYLALEQTCQYYQQQLRLEPLAIDYLKKRHLTGITAKNFLIGFAPDGWDHLSSITNQQNNLQAFITAGILIEGNDNKRPYPRFRNRIIFPIRNSRGKIIGFGGRALGDTNPKYLNSPETPIFHKQQELYGLYEAKKANKTLQHMIVVEGYMDVIALHQHGITSAVATLGTAINTQHIQTLLRYTHNIIFCFDGDNAGKKASWKALTMCLPLLKTGIEIQFLTLTDNQDPDDAVNHLGADAFNNLIDKAPKLSDVLFSHLEDKYPLTTIANKTQFSQEASQLISSIPHIIYRSLMEKALAAKIDMPLSTIQTLISAPPEPEAPKREPILITDINISKPGFFAACLLTHHPDLIKHIDSKHPISNPEIEGTELLMLIIEHLQSHPEITTTAQLTASLHDHPHETILRSLACKSIPALDTPMEEQLLTTLSRLKQLHQQHITNQLIAKAKLTPLSQTEKQQLQALLIKNNQDKLD